jgi:hypothetical protein
MKSIIKVVAVLILASFACATAFAADTQNVNVTLYRNFTLNGTQLKAGEYKVAITLTGADAKVVFMNGKTAVATASGKFAAAKDLGFGFGVVSKGAAVTAVQGDKIKGTIELQPASGGATGN